MATGGSSTNPVILQVLADVFQAPVYTLDCKDSACVGAAIRAYHGHLCKARGSVVAFDTVFERAESFYRLACNPNRDTEEIYQSMLEKIRECERAVMCM